jgi:hypothetical protein
MAASDRHITASFSEKRMMRIAYINQPTQRLALGPCFVHGSDRPDADVWSFSGRAAE